MDNNNWVWNQQSAHGLHIQTQDYGWQVPCKWLSCRWWCEGLSAWVWNVPDRTLDKKDTFRQSSRSCRPAWHTTTWSSCPVHLPYLFCNVYFKKSILIVHPDFCICLYIRIFLIFLSTIVIFFIFHSLPSVNPLFSAWNTGRKWYVKGVSLFKRNFFRCNIMKFITNHLIRVCWINFRPQTEGSRCDPS